MVVRNAICAIDVICRRIIYGWRKDKDSFDGKVELRLPPKPYSIDNILEQLKDLEDITLSKDLHVKTNISHDVRGDNWNKKSIFFKLPFWKTLLLRHNLDVMHIEKNICDNILGTIMNIKGKTKDNLKSRQDLQIKEGIEVNITPSERMGQMEASSWPIYSFPQRSELFAIFSKR